MARAFGELRGTLITKKCAPYDTECARKRQQANIIAPMGEQTAAGIEGLEDRSITIYEQEDLVRTGVRGVDGDTGILIGLKGIDIKDFCRKKFKVFFIGILIGPRAFNAIDLNRVRKNRTSAV